MTGIQEFAGSALVVLAQSTVLLGVILLMSRQLQRGGPAATSFALKAGLVGVTALVVLQFVPHHRTRALVQVPNPPQVAVFTPEISPAPKSALGRKQVESPEKPTEAASTPYIESTPPPIEVLSRASASHAGVITWPSAILGVWLAGTALLFSWLVWAQIRIAMLRKRSIPLTGGPAYSQLQALAELRGLPVPELRVHPEATSPFLFGIVHPTILADSSTFDGLDSESLTMIFEHELAHLRTNDCTWRLIERIVCALLWPQPLVWLLCKCLDHASEEVCDQFVISNSTSRKQYADCLLALANGKPFARTTQAFGAGVVTFRSGIGRRIAKIMDASQRISIRL